MTDSYARPSGGALDLETVRNETLRLASLNYSIETMAKIEALLWVLGHIDTDKCPTGVVDEQRIRDITDRGPWPFDPSLPEVNDAE